MAKGDLFYIKTNLGYGLFHDIGRASSYLGSFYNIYYTQIESLSAEEIKRAVGGEYYCQRILFDESGGNWKCDYYKKLMLTGKLNGAIPDMKDSDPYYGQCVMGYIGKFELPGEVTNLRYTRHLEFSYFTGKHKWYIEDEKEKDFVNKPNGKPVVYNRLTPEIEKYSDYLGAWPREILKRFNANYRQEDGDAWVERMLEEYYEENPHMRPTDIKFEEVKSPYPTESWRNNDGDKAYLEFIKEVESALDTFIESLESNKRSVQKPLSKLIAELNRIDKQTGFIGSMEAEDLYGYIVKILRSLKKPRLIELMEDKRTW